MTTVADLAVDLAAEHAGLDVLVSQLDDADWSRSTPSPGWAIRDQIAHLTYFDRAAAMAISDPNGFLDQRNAASERATTGQVDPLLATAAEMTPHELVTWWRGMRDWLVKAAAMLEDDSRLEWYGPSMGAKSFLTARLMETWAHGQDIADTVGGHLAPTARLRHIAQLGVITRSWSYINRGLDAPPIEVAVRLDAPDGSLWEWGAATHDGDGAQAVSGPALDFCHVVTQRRRVEGTRLEVVGDDAATWMRIAQAFAGPPTDGPGS